MVLGLLRKAGKKFGRSLGDTGVLSPQTLQISDFFSSDIAIVAGKENILGELVISPQMRQAFGFGTPEYSDNQGTIFINLKDNAGTPVELEGEVILSVQDYNGNNNRVVYRGQLSDLRSGASDITKRVKFPLVPIFGAENDKLVMKFVPKTIGSGSVGNDESSCLIASSVEYLGRV